MSPLDFGLTVAVIGGGLTMGIILIISLIVQLLNRCFPEGEAPRK